MKTESIKTKRPGRPKTLPVSHIQQRFSLAPKDLDWLRRVAIETATPVPVVAGLALRQGLATAKRLLLGQPQMEDGE